MRERECEVHEAVKRNGEEEERTEEPVPREVCDVKLCALLTLGLCLSWDRQAFELYHRHIQQPELSVCQEKWDRYLIQVRKTQMHQNTAKANMSDRFKLVMLFSSAKK